MNVCEEDVPTSAYTLKLQSSQSLSDFHPIYETLCFCCRCWRCLKASISIQQDLRIIIKWCDRCMVSRTTSSSPNLNISWALGAPWEFCLQEAHLLLLSWAIGHIFGQTWRHGKFGKAKILFYSWGGKRNEVRGISELQYIILYSEDLCCQFGPTFWFCWITYEWSHMNEENLLQLPLPLF